jgi:hypothetical protein
MYWWVPILTAVITGPVVVILQRLRHENTSQHAESRGLLEHLVIKFDKVDEKVDNLEMELKEHRNELRSHISETKYRTKTGEKV